MRYSFQLIAASMLCLAFQGCGKPDRGSPHEYVQIHAVSITTAGIRSNDISAISSSLIDWNANFFALGSGKCQVRLSKLTDERIRLHLRAWNQALRGGQLDMPPAVALQLQCVASLGRDEKCLLAVNKAAESIKDPQQLVDFLFANIPSCNLRRQVGQARLISLNEK